MIKLAANTVLFAAFDLETAMRSLADAGYDGVELSAITNACEHLDLDNWRAQAQLIKDLTEKYELELLAMEAASLDEERLMKAFEAGAEIGIPVINVGPGGKSGVDEDFERQTDLLALMAERAAEHDVLLCVKAHVNQSIDDTPTILKAMAKIPSSGFAVNMDPSHIYRAGENPVSALQVVIHRVGHVHIRDCVAREQGPGSPEGQVCGRGQIDLLNYVRVLHEAAIEVTASFEVIGAWDYELTRVIAIASESRGYLNACLQACGAR